jgi:PAS domain S-box-containing protein
LGCGLLPGRVCMRSRLVRHYDAVGSASWPFLLRYGIAVFSAGCAFLLTQLMPGVQQFAPFLFYLLAVLASSVYGGLGPGVLAALLGLLVAPGWVLSPTGMPPISNPYPLHTTGFVVMATGIVVFTYALRRTRRRLMGELRLYAAQLSYQQFLLDHVNDAVCVFDRDQRIMYWNRGAEALYGWTAAEALGQHMAELVRSVLPPEERRTRLAAVDAGDQQRVELLHHNRSGEPIYVEANVSTLTGAEGSAIGYVTINRDVTVRKKYEEELVDLSASLEERVEERTAELERRNRDLDQFAYIASHDLKAPLRAIDLLALWITEDAAPVLSPQSLQHLDKLNGRIRRMERLLDDLLAYSRVGRSHQPPERVDTRFLVQETVDLLNLPPGFQVVLPQAMPVLFTERVPLATVLRNLIQNAYKHHDHPERGCVTITVEDLGDATQFSVADDGPGIAPEFQVQVFDLFRTLKPRDEVEGSGMGLSVVKKTVESHGGAIHVTSAPSGGATFVFTWPRDEWEGGGLLKRT